MNNTASIYLRIGNISIRFRMKKPKKTHGPISPKIDQKDYDVKKDNVPDHSSMDQYQT